MEAFNILKFWRNTVGENVAPVGGDVITDIDYINSDYQKTPITPTNVSTDVRNRAPDFEFETEDDSDSFFDLEFTTLDEKNKSIKCCKFIESPTDVFQSDLYTTSKAQSQSPIAILRSAPKFKVLMLRFKKSKTDNLSKKENVPIDNSLKTKMMRELLLESNPDIISKKSENDSKKFHKLIKPLYTVASKRYTFKKLSAVSPMSSSSPATVVACSSPRRSSDEKGSNRGSRFEVVYKHLGKSRSASSAVGVMTCPVKRRDDSLLLHDDGIQSAILHCKRSYNSSNKGLSRCSLDSTPEELVIEEPKRCSI